MPQTQATKGTVLHVEDDAAVASSTELLLRLAGFRAFTAPDGETALRLITEGAVLPDVLIVDYNLPGDMDGSETVEAICRVLQEPLPTILLSGELSNATLPWMPGTPLWPMAKPASPELLIHAVETFVDLRHWCAAHRVAATTMPRCA
jgi:two-component system CheB/CheR fusion protein